MIENKSQIESPPDIFEQAILPTYKNIGWSLGNVCPMHCQQCYSRSTRSGDSMLTEPVIDHVIDQLTRHGVDSVNLGGNEPIYTNGEDEKSSLLPSIIDKISGKNIRIGITTSGPTIEIMDRIYPEQLRKLNDVDVSFDSSIPVEHDRNRGVRGAFETAVNALKICDKYSLPKTIIVCAMKWNFTPDRINRLIDLAVKYGANIRFNPLQPVEQKQFPQVLSARQFYEGLYAILKRCEPIEIGDPLWSIASGIPNSESGCPCGTHSFRIHSITPDGKMPISPCVYLHDFKFGDLLQMDLRDILSSPSFQAFIWRKNNKTKLKNCAGCDQLDRCGGGCAARAYLFDKQQHGTGSILQRDPYCLKDPNNNYESYKGVSQIAENIHNLVHANYLCTGIFYPVK